MIKAYLLASLQNVINHALQCDPDSVERLKALEGNVVLFTIKPFDFKLYVSIDKQVNLLSEYSGEAVASLRATGMTFVSLLLSDHEQLSRLLNRGKVTLEGDMAICQQLQRLFKDLDIDWEQQLAKFTGDVPAYHLRNLWRFGYERSQRTVKHLQTSISDYLQEEACLTPTGDEVTEFITAVDSLRLDVERLAANFHHLTEQNS